MSAEAFLISALVDEGSVKKAFQAGIGAEDFEMHDEEFEWIVHRAENRKPITPRLFKKAFPEFDFILGRERVGDLIDELKQERAFLTISSAIDDTLSDLDQDNAVQKAVQLRELLSNAVKNYSPVSDVLIKHDFQSHLDEQKELQIIRENGEVAGISTGLKNLDHHWGGLTPATTYVVLGRPGDAKSSLLGKFAVEAMLQGYRVGFFSPEMTERKHRCRFSTLLSAKREIQEACGLTGAFRNRALKDGRGYNIKTYKRFLEYCDQEIKGEICLFTQKYRRNKMSPAYIESRIEDLGLDLVVIDPIYKLRSPRKRQLKHEEIADIVDSLQDLSMGFNIPLVMSNQANRALVGSRGEAPTQDSSFGSDAPAQEADVVIGVKNFKEDRLIRLNCSKNRDGETFKFEIAFWPNVGKMDDITQIKGDYFNGYDPEKMEELQDALKENEATQTGH
jgi:replicative DNA helicase